MGDGVVVGDHHEFAVLVVANSMHSVDCMRLPVRKMQHKYAVFKNRLAKIGKKPPPDQPDLRGVFCRFLPADFFYRSEVTILVTSEKSAIKNRLKNLLTERL